MLDWILYPCNKLHVLSFIHVANFICSHQFPTSGEQDEGKRIRIEDGESVGVY
jgi:hypothetical protein